MGRTLTPFIRSITTVVRNHTVFVSIHRGGDNTILIADVDEGVFINPAITAMNSPTLRVPTDADSIFQFSLVLTWNNAWIFSISQPALEKCSYSETNYLKYTQGLKEGLLYAKLGSKVRAMNSLNRTSALWILNSIWLALSPRGECESGSRETRGPRLPCALSTCP